MVRADMADEASRKIPPHSVEAEESVLGGILLDNHALDRAIELVIADDFYREAHRRIFRAIIDLSERHEPVDLVTALREVQEVRNRNGFA